MYTLTEVISSTVEKIVTIFVIFIKKTKKHLLKYLRIFISNIEVVLLITRLVKPNLFK